MDDSHLTFFEEFADDLIVESGLAVPEESRKPLRDSLVERIEARLFLELIATLSEEQASQVRQVLEEDATQDMKKTFDVLAQQIPDAQGYILASLMRMREELLKDLTDASLKANV
jgi:hypothetical protein